MRKGNNRVRSLDCFLGGSQERASLRTGSTQAALHRIAKAEPIPQLSGEGMGVAGRARVEVAGFRGGGLLDMCNHQQTRY
ncbi:MAG: hypothetical protein C0402_01510 [Thermodesulfovibrio sp.]|nr:hypothetical protein [Thermodesulfovibrio sp.]